jgi:glycosylphosphatidylinositol transamidase
VYLSAVLVRFLRASSQQLQVMQTFSLLVLGAALSTWATINFSLALIVGLLATPLAFVRPLPLSKSEAQSTFFTMALSIPTTMLYLVASPPVAIYAISWYFKKDVAWLLMEIAKGWVAQGVWSHLVIWSVWWPAWVLGGVVLYSGAVRPRI